MNLTEHFTLAEMTATQVRHASNVPGRQEKENLRRLCEEILEPLREAFGRPMRVTSGYRSQAVNRAVGGSRTSDHMKGLAADIQVDGYTPIQVCRKIVALGLPYKQVIQEFGRWTHVSIDVDSRPDTPSGELLTARSVDGKTVYVPGLFAA